MLKIWLALVLAVSAAVVSMTAGILHDTRLPVVLYRAFISAACLGGIGFLLGVLYERTLLPYLAARILKQRQADNAGEDEVKKPAESEADEETSDIESTDADEAEQLKAQEEPSDFAPFTTDQFKRVSPPNS